jgi:hypothetical protein
VGAPDEVLPARPDANEAASGLEELVELGGGDPPLEADAPLLALGLDDLRLSPIESGRWMASHKRIHDRHISVRIVSEPI